VALDNPGASAQPVEVSLSLPTGIRVASIEDAPVSSDPPVWQLNLPAGGQRVLHLQVVLPDQAGSYSIESTIKVNGQAIADPPTLVLEVPRSTQEALADVIAELETLEVPPGGRGHVQAAIAYLRIAQAQRNGLAGLEARIRFAAEAAAKLGKVEIVDVSGPRSEIARLIAAWERASYELASG